MRDVQVEDVEFDSFGEPLPVGRLNGVAPQTAISRWMMRAGTGLFWWLVVVIVLARAVYFDPDFAEKFGSVAALSHAVRTALGV